MLKEALDIVSSYGYVAAGICAFGLVRRMSLLSNSKRGFEPSPETKIHAARTKKIMRSMGIPSKGCALK